MSLQSTVKQYTATSALLDEHAVNCLLNLTQPSQLSDVAIEGGSTGANSLSTYNDLGLQFQTPSNKSVYQYHYLSTGGNPTTRAENISIVGGKQVTVQNKSTFSIDGSILARNDTFEIQVSNPDDGKILSNIDQVHLADPNGSTGSVFTDNFRVINSSVAPTYTISHAAAGSTYIVENKVYNLGADSLSPVTATGTHPLSAQNINFVAQSASDAGFTGPQQNMYKISSGNASVNYSGSNADVIYTTKAGVAGTILNSSQNYVTGDLVPSGYTDSFTGIKQLGNGSTLNVSVTAPESLVTLKSGASLMTEVSTNMLENATNLALNSQYSHPDELTIKLSPPLTGFATGASNSYALGQSSLIMNDEILPAGKQAEPMYITFDSSNRASVTGPSGATGISATVVYPSDNNGTGIRSQLLDASSVNYTIEKKISQTEIGAFVNAGNGPTGCAVSAITGFGNEAVVGKIVPTTSIGLINSQRNAPFSSSSSNNRETVNGNVNPQELGQDKLALYYVPQFPEIKDQPLLKDVSTVMAIGGAAATGTYKSCFGVGSNLSITSTSGTSLINHLYYGHSDYTFVADDNTPGPVKWDDIEAVNGVFSQTYTLDMIKTGINSDVGVGRCFFKRLWVTSNSPNSTAVQVPLNPGASGNCVNILTPPSPDAPNIATVTQHITIPAYITGYSGLKISFTISYKYNISNGLIVDTYDQSSYAFTLSFNVNTLTPYKVAIMKSVSGTGAVPVNSIITNENVKNQYAYNYLQTDANGPVFQRYIEPRGLDMMLVQLSASGSSLPSLSLLATFQATDSVSSIPATPYIQELVTSGNVIFKGFIKTSGITNDQLVGITSYDSFIDGLYQAGNLEQLGELQHAYSEVTNGAYPLTIVKDNLRFDVNALPANYPATSDNNPNTYINTYSGGIYFCYFPQNIVKVTSNVVADQILGWSNGTDLQIDQGVTIRSSRAVSELSRDVATVSLNADKFGVVYYTGQTIGNLVGQSVNMNNSMFSSTFTEGVQTYTSMTTKSSILRGYPHDSVVIVNRGLVGVAASLSYKNSNLLSVGGGAAWSKVGDNITMAFGGPPGKTYGTFVGVETNPNINTIEQIKQECVNRNCQAFEFYFDVDVNKISGVHYVQIPSGTSIENIGTNPSVAPSPPYTVYYLAPSTPSANAPKTGVRALTVPDSWYQPTYLNAIDIGRVENTQSGYAPDWFKYYYEWLNLTEIKASGNPTVEEMKSYAKANGFNAFSILSNNSGVYFFKVTVENSTTNSTYLGTDISTNTMYIKSQNNVALWFLKAGGGAPIDPAVYYEDFKHNLSVSQATVASPTPLYLSFYALGGKGFTMKISEPVLTEQTIVYKLNKPTVSMSFTNGNSGATSDNMQGKTYNSIDGYAAFDFPSIFGKSASDLPPFAGLLKLRTIMPVPAQQSFTLTYAEPEVQIAGVALTSDTYGTDPSTLTFTTRLGANDGLGGWNKAGNRVVGNVTLTATNSTTPFQPLARTSYLTVLPSVVKVNYKEADANLDIVSKQKAFFPGMANVSLGEGSYNIVTASSGAILAVLQANSNNQVTGNFVVKPKLFTVTGITVTGDASPNTIFDYRVKQDVTANAAWTLSNGVYKTQFIQDNLGQNAGLPDNVVVSVNDVYARCGTYGNLTCGGYLIEATSWTLQNLPLAAQPKAALVPHVVKTVSAQYYMVGEQASNNLGGLIELVANKNMADFTIRDGYVIPLTVTKDGQAVDNKLMLPYSQPSSAFPQLPTGSVATLGQSVTLVLNQNTKSWQATVNGNILFDTASLFMSLTVIVNNIPNFQKMITDMRQVYKVLSLDMKDLLNIQDAYGNAKFIIKPDGDMVGTSLSLVSVNASLWICNTAAPNAIAGM